MSYLVANPEDRFSREEAHFQEHALESSQKYKEGKYSKFNEMS